MAGVAKQGHYIVAPCPKCGGSDRFICGPKVNYAVFACRQCEHTLAVNAILGIAWQSDNMPAVKPWTAPTVDAGRLDAIRAIYGALTTFAQAQLQITPHAIEYLNGRGMTPVQLSLNNVGLGYIDAKCYRQWWQTLDAGQRAAAQWAGLPDGERSRFSGHAAMFAGGHMGKILFAYYNASGQVVDLRTRSISPNDTINGKQVRYASPTGSQADRGADAPYAVHLAQGPQVVLTEGEFKALAANLLAGVPALALRGTSDWNDAYLNHLRGKLVILAFDNDRGDGLPPGQVATVKMGRLLVAHDIDVMVLDPAYLGDCKGIDDYIAAHGGAAFAELVKPRNLCPLSIYEYQLRKAGDDLSKFKAPRVDVGTVRQWAPAEQVDAHAHQLGQTVTVEQAGWQIAATVRAHVENWHRGQAQVLITAPAGVGKTHETVKTVLDVAGTTGQTVAIILPNHATIDEKIADGTLAGFQHIYGRNADNCEQSDHALALTKKGYSPGALLCPDCPALAWCNEHGYKSQFKGPAHRAYPHAHLHTSYPGGEDLVIVDELTHKSFISSMQIGANDIASTLAADTLTGPQRWLLDGINRLFQAPGLGDLEGTTFYSVLESVYPPLRNVSEWADADSLQAALTDLVISADGQSIERLPQQYGAKLISLLAEDVLRLNRGEPVTGRVRLVSVANSRWIELTYSKGALPGWFTSRPVVILNATADCAIMNDVAGPLRTVAPQVAIAAGNEVAQDVTYNNAKSAYAGQSEDAERRRVAWLDGIRTHISAHAGGEVDTTIIVAKALAPIVERAFPLARVAYYHALEGRNDLQRGLTILASAVPINIDAIRREAAALWPGIDQTLTRNRVAFDYANAAGELLTTEQIDGLDPRLSALIAQHRDAAAVQAVHRSRIIRQSGRRVVIMFARPIPGIRPTTVTTDRPTGEDKRSARHAEMIQRLISAAGELVAERGGCAVDELAALAEVAVNTARKYLPEVYRATKFGHLALPVLQPLANGGQRRRNMDLILSPDLVAEIRQSRQLHVNHERNNSNSITTVIYVQLGKFLPSSTWQIDVDALTSTIPPVTNAENAPAPEARPGRWRAVLDALALKADLQRAQQGDAATRRHANHLIAWLNGKHEDSRQANEAASMLGIKFKIDWRMAREESFADAS